MEKRLLNTREAAKYLGICARTLWSLSASRQIPRVKVGGKSVRFDVGDLNEFIERSKTGESTDG